MKIINSISGGRSSAFMSIHYPADINIFSLCLIDSPKFKWLNGKDEITRKLVSDKLGKEFVGTSELDLIIYTILDLEQVLGKEIKFVSGLSWEKLIIDRKGYLPSHSKRFCTTEFKVKPIFDYLYSLKVLPVIQQLGFRYGEESRKQGILNRCLDNGFIYEYKQLDLKPGSRYHNREHVKYNKPIFPLIDNLHDVKEINSFWSKKNVRFAEYNNCLNCVNRSPLFLNHLSSKYKAEFEKGIYIEEFARLIAKNYKFEYQPQLRPEATMKRISEFAPQIKLFDSDFNSCDSGYCGI